MREEFTNAKGQTLTFTDTYLQYTAVPQIKSIPYDKIAKIKCSFIGLIEVKGNDTIICMALDNKDKPRVKELVDYAKKNPQYFYNNPTFREEFISAGKNMVAFTNNGIEYYSALPEKTITNYENIEKIDVTSMHLSITEIDKTFTIYSHNADDTERLKKTVKEVNDIIKSKERRIRCNVCGHIFCYTNEDIERNNHNKTLAGLHSFSAVVNAVGGTAYNMHEEQKHADAVSSKIIDYSKCPKCNSSDITAITEEEWQNMNSKSVTATNNNLSVADEIKKFKDLLDNGIITQEEFDEKKKQLLGL